MALQLAANSSNHLQASAAERLFQELSLDDKHHEDHEDHPSRKSGYVYDSPEEIAAMKAQRSAVWEWLKDVGSHLLTDGLNLTKISMPVTLFEPRSWLERMCDNWSYLDLLECAAGTRDPVERMKYIIAFVVGGLRQQVSFGKPFNPILGETYQAEYTEGIQVFVEQISHHPPISSWQMVDPQGRFSLWGNGTWAASARGNSVKGHQSGKNCVRFSSDGALVTWELPFLVIKVALQNRNRPRKQCIFLDKSVWAEKEKECAARSGLWHYSNGQVLDTIHGSWLTHLDWENGVVDGKLSRVWDLERSLVRRPDPVACVLQSDSRHRKDLSNLKLGDLESAQQWKVELEQLQRQDQKARAESGVKS